MKAMRNALKMSRPSGNYAKSAETGVPAYENTSTSVVSTGRCLLSAAAGCWLLIVAGSGWLAAWPGWLAGRPRPAGQLKRVAPAGLIMVCVSLVPKASDKHTEHRTQQRSRCSESNMFKTKQNTKHVQNQTMTEHVQKIKHRKKRRTRTTAFEQLNDVQCHPCQFAIMNFDACEIFLRGSHPALRDLKGSSAEVCFCVWQRPLQPPLVCSHAPPMLLTSDDLQKHLGLQTDIVKIGIWANHQTESDMRLRQC